MASWGFYSPTAYLLCGHYVFDMDPAVKEDGSDGGVFRINTGSIQEVEKVDQPVELQGLDVRVYDQSTLESGILCQVGRVLGSELEDGQQAPAGAAPPVPVFQLLNQQNENIQSNAKRNTIEKQKAIKESDNLYSGYELYFRRQVELELSRKNAAKRGRKSSESEPDRKRAMKVVDLGPKKCPKKAAERLGTSKGSRRGSARAPPKQPAELSCAYLNYDSGSEYVPSGSASGSRSSEEGYKQAGKPSYLGVQDGVVVSMFDYRAKGTGFDSPRGRSWSK
ncbi:hypothetical protein AAG570_004730 [Ranatra chinensis]|uniref:Uncharacterized protein n=1 Tax=Ranatra chinensis TaxID=642074 RepID=A0ABD0YNJ6_9HEMI